MNSRNGILISNGFHKFHLAFAAEALAEVNRLSFLMTGAYPTRSVKKLIKSLGLTRWAATRRLNDRRVNVPSHLIRSYWLGEIAQHIGRFAQSLGFSAWSDYVLCFGMRLYANQATVDLKRLSPGCAIYHYRAGFGGASVAVAKGLGLIAVCDHSVVHPALFEQMVRDDGRISTSADITISAFWKLIRDDIDRGDHVLVNSDFVKHTFQRAGADTRNVHVIYLGIDREFADVLTFEDIAAIKTGKPDVTPNILFAGGFNKRKGAIEVIEALSRLPDLPMRFTIAGTVDADIFSYRPDFFASPKVRQLGWISRPELARVMAASDIFLFPSRAEGSARVVFEALASGCFVITTENSGTIVADGMHGSIVPPGDGAALARVLGSALRNIEETRRIGLQNATLVRSCYTQLHYARSLLSLYDVISEVDRS